MLADRLAREVIDVLEPIDSVELMESELRMREGVKISFSSHVRTYLKRR